MSRYLLSLVVTLLLCCSFAFVAAPTHAADAPKKKSKKATAAIGDRSLARADKNSASGKRVALVIGNSAYRHTDSMPKLANPVNDADDMAAALRRFGFAVTPKKNLTKEQMDEAIADFGRNAANSDAALFYYAGHGLQVKGQNYLVPVDANIDTEAQVPYRAVNVNQLLEEMDSGKSRVNIVMLDACRNNPISGKFRSGGGARGLAPPSSMPKGTVIVYATAPGDVAADGGGRNGLFTAGLLSAFNGSNLTLNGVLYSVNKQVKVATNNQQTPYVNGPPDVLNEFSFTSPSSMTDLQPSPVQPQPIAPAPVYKQPVEEKAPAPAKKASRSLTDPTTGMEFVPVPGGCFRMGDSTGDGQADEKPVHEVCVDAFSMGRYEVKVGEFRKFVADTGYRTDAEKGGGCYTADSNGSWSQKSSANWKSPGFTQSDDHPAICVSHNDATEFSRWLSRASGRGYRLPTEAEWEYAARGGTTTRNYWGNGKDDACGYANVADRTAKRQFSSWTTHDCDDGYLYTAPAGSFKPNDFGLYDMMGNAWEWLSDWYGDKYYGESPRSNPQGPSSGSMRVLRGGSWVNSPGYVRSSKRYWDNPDVGNGYSGFRLVSPP